MIHGGFFSESSTSSEVKLAKQQALKRIAEAAHAYLLTHSALETVAFAVQMLEDDPLFNAGTGSQIQSDGIIRMSAAIMDGQSARFSGVINLENVQNPIQVAVQLFSEDDRVLGGEGAGKFAKEAGFPFYNPEIPQRRGEYEAKLKATGIGTVGCVALDGLGRLAAATSTGGKGFERVGRISDSATVAGNYANEFCAVSCTGVGEDIVSGAIAAKIVTRVSDGMAATVAVERTFNELKSFDGFAGAIVLTATGEMIWQDSHPHMVWAHTDGESTKVFD